MRKTPYISFIVLLIIFISGAIFTLSASPKEKAQPAKDSLKRYYDDEKVFQKLSGAAQSALIRIYGPKKGKGQQLGSGPVSPISKSSPSAPNAALVNVPVNDPALDLTAQNTQSESSIVLAGSNIVVGYNDSGECTDGCNTEQHFTGYSYSTDGGASFVDGGALPDDPAGFPWGDVGDPILGYDSTNNIVHYATLGLNFATGNGPSLKCFRSTDQGVTWSTSVDCTPGFAATDFQDKQWLAVDNFVGTGQGNVYMAWRQFSNSDPQGIRFVRSTDAGATWGPSPGTLIADEGAFNVQGAFVAVGPDHAVYVAWLDQSAGGGTPHILRARKSTDQGVTWGTAEDITTFTNTAVNGDVGLSGGFRSNGFPHVVVIPAGSLTNDVVFTYNDLDPVDGDPDVYGLECLGGDISACDPPFQINTDSTLNDQFMPTLANTPDGGDVFFTWYDRRNDPGNNLIERFGKIFNTATPPTADFLMSDNPFPPVFGQDPVVNSVYMGDYDQAVADNSFFYASFLDTELGTQDVVFTKVPRAGPGAVLALGAVTTDDSGGNNNGEIDFNECIDMNVVLNNFGSSTATGVSATLSTTTPNVNITSAVSAYPDIAPSSSQTNTTPFQFETSAIFVCGTPIDFTLDVTTTSAGAGGGANFSFSFTIQTGGIGPASQYDNNTPTPIVDNGTVDIPITVAGFAGNVGKVTVSFHTTHTWDGDLDISLIAPNGDEVELTSDNGGSGDNYGTDCANRTVFDDDAVTAITSGAPPFVGTFSPEGSLSDFIGKTGTDVNGTWLLRFTDDFLQDTGTIQCSSLFLSPTQCTDGGGPCGAGCPNPPTITTTSLPNGAEGVPYSQTVQATGGTPPYAWSISAGTLPPGLALNPTTGEISGTPTVGSAGTYNFTVMVTDTVPGCSDTQPLSITIDVAPACTYEDLFDDSVLTWTQVKPVVTETGGNLVHTPTNKKAYSTSDPVFAGIQNGTITAEIMFTTNGELKEKGTMLTHWVDKKNLVEIQFNIAKGKVIVKQKADGVLAKDNGLFAFAFDTLYTVTANYDGTDYEVSIDGTPVVTLTPVGTIPSGIIGFTARGLNELVNRVCVTP